MHWPPPYPRRTHKAGRKTIAIAARPPPAAESGRVIYAADTELWLISNERFYDLPGFTSGSVYRLRMPTWVFMSRYRIGRIDKPQNMHLEPEPHLFDHIVLGQKQYRHEKGLHVRCPRYRVEVRRDKADDTTG